MNAPKQPHNPQPDTTQQWATHAACKGSTHHMFPTHHKDTQYIIQARHLCRSCPVKPDCLNYALQFPAADMHGVWAGMTPRQLAAEQRRRGIRPTRPTIAQLWAEWSGRRSDGNG